MAGDNSTSGIETLAKKCGYGDGTHGPTMKECTVHETQKQEYTKRGWH
jgi:hypothetical protein